METVPSFKPECPVCHIPLDGIPFPMPKSGVGECPNGGLYSYEIEVDEEETVVDKFGNVTKKKGWLVTGDDQH